MNKTHSHQEIEEMLKQLPRPRAKPGRVQPRQQKNKYGNKICNYDGFKFHSIRERNRYIVLKEKQNKGQIKGLKLQVVFVLADAVVLDGRKRPALKYVADFVYDDVTSGQAIRIVEDSKGFRTADYRIKRHLMMSVHSIEVKEV